MKKRLISFLLAVVAFSSFTGCNYISGNEPYQEPAKYTYTDGVHVYDAPIIQDKYLVKNGATEYKILLPQTMTDDLRVARDELIYFFKEATGITLSFEIENET